MQDISSATQFQGTHLRGKEGIYIMPGAKLGASSQGCQHILFVWDLESRDQGNLRGSRNAPGKVLENSGKEAKIYHSVDSAP